MRLIIPPNLLFLQTDKYFLFNPVKYSTAITNVKPILNHVACITLDLNLCQDVA